MTFRFSSRSRSRLQGVHKDLVEVAELAITLTTVDFSVIEGLRSEERQRELVARGASKTMNSRHLTGHAIDIAPYVNGIRWDWPLFYPLADAMRRAAIELDVPVRWGGVWDVKLNDLPEGGEGAELAVERYIERRRTKGKRAFTDGPHFELHRSRYP